MFTKYGKDILWRAGAGAVIVIVCSSLYIPMAILRYAIVALVLILTGLVLNFFRDPKRTVPSEPNIIVSPADGKVVLLKEIMESEYLCSPAYQVSIFMSPLDVHVNRFPISGTIEYFKHIPGAFRVAFDDKSSELNERTHIGIAGDECRVFFRQVAGAVARRIVADLSLGQQVLRGERFGMIKFGSRVDVLMPKTAEVAVVLNQRVKAGETILGRYRSRTAEHESPVN